MARLLVTGASDDSNRTKQQHVETASEESASEYFPVADLGLAKEGFY